MAEAKQKVLVLGASGMLGNAVFRFFSGTSGHDAWGSVRSTAAQRLLPHELRQRLISGVDVESDAGLARLFAEVQPQVAVNCIGLIKQLAEGQDPLSAIAINSLLPHRLARHCRSVGARLVHISTDCVFAGTKGMYREDDSADAQDLYGRSKYLGEVAYPHAVTLRTSIIGHELASTHGLVGWFLAQSNPIKGYNRAIFSGLPTVELARVIRDHVLPHPALQGLYHISAAPISKHELLQLVARIYGKGTKIVPDDRLVIDRSLDSTRFRELTGYEPPDWPTLVRAMHEFG